MRMAANHLRIHITAHICHGKFARIGGDLALQNHLQKNIAQLFTKMRRVVLFDSIDSLVRLFDHVAGDGFMGLLAVPRAAVRSAQSSYGINESSKRFTCQWRTRGALLRFPCARLTVFAH